MAKKNLPKKDSKKDSKAIQLTEQAIHPKRVPFPKKK